MKKICVATSVHYAFDTRIYFKQVTALSRQYYVDYYAQQCDDANPETSGEFMPLPKAKSKFARIITNYRLFKLLKNSHYDVYHLHDPELLPLCLYLKMRKKRVIFDMHENISQQIKDKEWIPAVFRMPLSYVIARIETLLPRLCDHIILTDDSYLEKYKELSNVTVIHNYPEQRSVNKENYQFSIFKMVYVGDVSKDRGIMEYLKILKAGKENNLELKFYLIGRFASSTIEKMVKDYIETNGLEKSIKFFGRIPNNRVYEILLQCEIGLALLHPIKNYISSYPTKIFEYMSVGLPVLASNFQLYKQIVEDNECGYVVDPFNTEEALNVIKIYYNNSSLLKKQGQNGTDVSYKKYNWKIEEEKMLSIYDRILSAETV